MKIMILLIFLCSGNILFGQYLRDSTRFLGLDDFYPKDDSLIFANYADNEIYPITLDSIFSIPEIPVIFGDEPYPFTFDFGNSGNIAITNAIADSLEFVITDTAYTYTPDGKIRGRVYDIILCEFHTLSQSFSHEPGTLSDWSIFSTEPFNGLIGLKYVDGRCFTLSYPRKILAISDQSFTPNPVNQNTAKIQMEHFDMHPYGVHFKGKVNGRDAIIYLDTGKSHSAVNQYLVQPDKILSDKSGAFYGGTLEIKMGSKTFEIYYPRVKDTGRDIKSDLPVGIEIGSDILQYFLLTIDRTHDQNVLIIH